MNALKHICLTFNQLVKKVGSIPAAIRRAVKQSQRQMELKELETERLDRIRNPSKYRGK